MPEQYDECPPASVVNWKSKFESVQIERDKSTALLFLYGLLSTLRRNEETNEREVEMRVQMTNMAGFFEKPLET